MISKTGSSHLGLMPFAQPATQTVRQVSPLLLRVKRFALQHGAAWVRIDLGGRHPTLIGADQRGARFRLAIDDDPKAWSSALDLLADDETHDAGLLRFLRATEGVRYPAKRGSTSAPRYGEGRQMSMRYRRAEDSARRRGYDGALQERSPAELVFLARKPWENRDD